jgi:hypothetical protein
MRLSHAALESRSRMLGFVRLACIAVIIVTLAGVGLSLLPPRAAWGTLATAIAFVVLVVVHARVDRERDRKDAAARFHERALGRLADQKTPRAPLPANVEADPTRAEQHPYASDLDMIGPDSVCAYVSFVRTQPGERTIGRWLLAADDPPAVDEIRKRQDAARALANKPELARALFVAGAAIGERPESAIAFETWALAKEPSAVPPVFSAIAWVLPILSIGALVAGNVLGWPTMATYGPYMVAVVMSLALRARIGKVVAAVVANEGGALAYAEAFDAALESRFDGELLARVQGDVDTGRAALRALRAPTRALEAMQNEVFRLLVAPLVMGELHAVLALERWRQKFGASSSKWFAAYGALEALASFGMLAHDFPTFAWPELGDDLRFEARALGHPLVPAARRVCNDLTGLEAGHALVVTGSNMSGKSTLLRSIGVATAMAMAGAPVCADKLALGPVRLVTSMRVSDSLSEGASRFYAELRRLSLVTQMAAKAPGVLFLLDEVLYGTNARERLIGSRATLAWLLDHGALGAVSTHDLALADLEGALAGKARNVHFEEQVAGDTMSFDYKLREGVVKSSNALRLMRQLGLPVGDS